MTEDIEIRPLVEGEEEALSEMVREVFRAFIAPGFKAEGVIEFNRFAAADSMRRRRELGSSFALAAWSGGEPAALIEVSGHSHINLLFVSKSFQGGGLARRMVEAAVERCREQRKDFDGLTVNSAPAARHVYEKLGFKATAEERENNGIRHVPMRLDLD